MHVPAWLAITIACAVILFGCYRLWIAAAGPPDSERTKARRGMLAMPRRTHALIGIIYLLVGGALIATSMGWNPFRKSTPAKVAPPPAPGSGLQVKP